MKRSSTGERLWKMGVVAGMTLAMAAPVMAWQDSQPPAEDKPRQPRQPRPRPTPPTTPPTTPGTPTAPGQPGAKQPVKPAPVVPRSVKEPGPYIVEGRSRDWTLTVDVDVKSERSSDWISPDGGKTKMPYIGQFDFATLAMVFMVPPATGNGRPDDRSIKGKFRIDDKIVNEKPVLIEKQVAGPLYHSGMRLLRFDTETPAQARQIEIEFEMKWRCWETEFDEAKAREVPWPTGPWPDAAAATLGPQLFVNYERTRDAKTGQPLTGEYDPQVLAQIVNEWSQGNPKGASPVMMAKYFAGQVAATVQPSGLQLKYLSTGQFQGFDLQGPVATLQRKRGSEFDMTTTLAAVYRAAGLPARIVIGYEKEDTRDRDSDGFGRTGSGKEKLRSWVEFCLYDEAKGTVNWVPVDVVALRKKTGGRAPDLTRPWPYFGTNDELDYVIPLALGFHPPTTVESYGAPALWGWLMSPYAPTTAYQAVRFRATTSSVRGDDKKDDKQNKKKDPY